MENLDVKEPLMRNGTNNGTYAPVIDLPAAAVTPLVVRASEQDLHDAAVYTIAAERERKRHRDMTVCGVIDAADFLLGWVPVVGQLLNVIGAIACVSMFGPKGFFVLLEMIDITGIVGAFVPTCTLVGRSYWNEH